MTNLQSLGLPVGMPGGPVPGVPIGAIVMSIQALYERTTAPVYTGNAEFNIPVGYLICNGRWYYKAEFPLLWDVYDAAQHARTETGINENFTLITSYIDDAAGTFQVPDLLSRMVLGRGDTLAAEDYYSWKDDSVTEVNRDVAVHVHTSGPAHSHVNGSYTTGNFNHTQATNAENTGATQRITGNIGHDHGAIGGSTNTAGTGPTDSITKAGGLAQLGVTYLIRAY